MNEATLGVIRHVLTFVGGWLVTKGYVDDSTMTAVVGGLATLIGGVWSYFKNKLIDDNM